MLNERDYLHEKAMEISATLTNQRIVTTEMVLTELLNYASREGQHLCRIAGDTAAELAARRNVEVIPQTSDQFHQALERYRSRLDQSWSIVDCASFIVMEHARSMKPWPSTTTSIRRVSPPFYATACNHPPKHPPRPREPATTKATRQTESFAIF